MCRWRTCLIVRELEEEIDALAQGQAHRNKLKVGLSALYTDPYTLLLQPFLILSCTNAPEVDMLIESFWLTFH